jgi:hypothetical protein
MRVGGPLSTGSTSLLRSVGGGLSQMVNQDLQGELAGINCRIAEGRKRIEGQKALISRLGVNERSSERPIALLTVFNDILRVMIAHRATILIFARNFPLPRTVCTETKGKWARIASARTGVRYEAMVYPAVYSASSRKC